MQKTLKFSLITAMILCTSLNAKVNTTTKSEDVVWEVDVTTGTEIVNTQNTDNRTTNNTLKVSKNNTMSITGKTINIQSGWWSVYS